MPLIILAIISIVRMALSSPVYAEPGDESYRQSSDSVNAEVSNSGAALRSDEVPSKPFYSDGKQGWWWYKDPVKKQPKNGENDKTAQSLSKSYPSLKDYTPDQLWNMRPDEFRKLWLEFRDKSVQNPSNENMREFYTMTDLASSKALAFTNSYTAYVAKHPDFAMNYEYPTNIPGSGTSVVMQNEEISKEINGRSTDYGLIYFYSHTCQFCARQSSILNIFKRHFPSFEVKAIEVGENPDLADLFNVHTVPHIVLIYRYNEKESMPISTGVIDADDLQHRIYRAMRLLRGETTEEQFNTYDYLKGTGMDPSKDSWAERQRRNGTFDNTEESSQR